jgi:predicted RecA/RadA family phage recombinase
MVNQVLTGTPTSRRFTLCPSTVKAGDPVLIGGVLPAVALDSYQANEGGATFLLGGTFNLPVYGQSVLSPPTNHALAPGALVYADGGTTDPTTGMITGFSLDANAGGVLFGHIDPQYTAGVLSGLAPDTAAQVLITRGV